MKDKDCAATRIRIDGGESPMKSGAGISAFGTPLSFVAYSLIVAGLIAYLSLPFQQAVKLSILAASIGAGLPLVYSEYQFVKELRQHLDEMEPAYLGFRKVIELAVTLNVLSHFAPDWPPRDELIRNCKVLAEGLRLSHTLNKDLDKAVGTGSTAASASEFDTTLSQVLVTLSMANPEFPGLFVTAWLLTELAHAGAASPSVGAAPDEMLSTALAGVPRGVAALSANRNYVISSRLTKHVGMAMGRFMPSSLRGNRGACDYMIILWTYLRTFWFVTPEVSICRAFLESGPLPGQSDFSERAHKTLLRAFGSEDGIDQNVRMITAFSYRPEPGA